MINRKTVVWLRVKNILTNTLVVVVDELTSSIVAWNLCSDNVDENDVESGRKTLFRNDSLEIVTKNTLISWFEVKSLRNCRGFFLEVERSAVVTPTNP